MGTAEFGRELDQDRQARGLEQAKFLLHIVNGQTIELDAPDLHEALPRNPGGLRSLQSLLDKGIAKIEKTGEDPDYVEPVAG